MGNDRGVPCLFLVTSPFYVSCLLYWVVSFIDTWNLVVFALSQLDLSIVLYLSFKGHFAQISISKCIKPYLNGFRSSFWDLSWVMRCLMNMATLTCSFLYLLSLLLHLSQGSYSTTSCYLATCSWNGCNIPCCINIFAFPGRFSANNCILVCILWLELMVI